MANQILKPGTPPSFPWMGGDFDQYFNRFMQGWPFRWGESRADDTPRALRAFEHMPQVEVKENGKHYTITVELPGLDEKDVKAVIEDDILSISGEKKMERTDEKTHYSERSFGSFTRSFTLPPDADRNGVSAKFAKGVLTLEIAKTANAPQQGKQIEIKPS
jgi:HSP20 family protein